jgi:hypothetical protein
VPGTIPGVLGVGAFGGTKFVGYSLAVSSLKKFEPDIAASRTRIAAVRTGFGPVQGPLLTLLVLFLSSLVFFRSSHSSGSAGSSFQMLLTYGILFVVRVFVSALVLLLFTVKSALSKSSFWLYSLLGAMVSSLLDWPGSALAIAAPGKIVFC